ncbi:unnamed protein product [Adineta ricciae]|uniref:Nuclear receptor domain-containing protein n=1 Tax=Adineta ricciae TaxID=249248 RepID=A0A814HQY5_ADIRI|nr:unnamed protein product [Adineta ricciae]
MTTSTHYCESRSPTSFRRCVVCGSKSIGINFGVQSCAPCKAFFRRNARRKELLELPCRHRDLSSLLENENEANGRSMRYLQIRRCSSCRLRRSFEMGMKEELVRTDEENERYRQMLDYIINDIDLLAEIDWSHLSNISYAYDSCCVKSYVRQRTATIFNGTSSVSDNQSINIYPTVVTTSIVLSVSSFLKSLPAFYSLPRVIRNYLCKTNIRPLIFPNIYELQQCCYHEPWQAAVFKATWQLMCGPQLYPQFQQAELLASKSLVTDPIATRLFFIILFFSTPLHYHQDSATPTKVLKKKRPVTNTQNAYITLLWKYLSYRYDELPQKLLINNNLSTCIRQLVNEIMIFSDDTMANALTSKALESMTTSTHYCGSRSPTSFRRCVVCGSKSIGINFGVQSCAPCKAFFRRNARRKELLELPCRHRDLSSLLENENEANGRSMRYLQIRRCSSCRLRRSFEMGMKEELVRTDEENERYKQLVDINRQRRELLRQQLLEMKALPIPQCIFANAELSHEIDWTHLSNIVYAYNSCCIQTYVRQRTSVIFKDHASTKSDPQLNSVCPTSAAMSIVLSVSSFLKSLPAFYSLPRVIRNYLCKTNIRPLIFPNIHELQQCCYHEPWQMDVLEGTWRIMCGPQLYPQFQQAELLASKSLVTDPIAIRLFFIILFFSTPLHYHQDSATPTKVLKKKRPVTDTQNAYITLLWKYLSYRYGSMETVRIYTHLVHVYIKMQTVGFGIYTRLATQKNLMPTNETLNKLVAIDVHEVQIS